MRTREVDAYRKRLAKISEQSQPGMFLTRECLHAVVTYYVPEDKEYAEATLIGFTYRTGMGLFGPRVMLDVSLCDDCVGKPGQCGPDHECVIEDAHIVSIKRNEAAS